MSDNKNTPLVEVKNLKKYFDISTGLLFVSIKSCWEYLCVVEDECVTLSEVFNNILEEFVLDFTSVLMKNHKFALVSPSRRLCCNLL